MKKIAILGSTGSIGTQTLDVCRRSGIEVYSAAAASNTRLLAEQAREFGMKKVCIFNSDKYNEMKTLLADTDISVVSGMEGLCELASDKSPDLVVNSVVGMLGLLPTLTAIASGHDVALANKETLVTGGQLVMPAAKKHGVTIYPIDSEHSAIFQCLQGCPENSLKKIILTASGGAFYGRTKSELEKVTVADALKHPNWSMGAKITVDSATMMNKGLEVIEASWLFDVPDEKIDVLIHRESIIHSMIQLKDNSVIAQLGVPDMRIPIQYALTYPNRLESPVRELDLSEIAALTFSKPDEDTFECLTLCREALRKGGLYPAAANAANEAAVKLFLEGRIPFLKIPELVKRAVSDFNVNKPDFSLDDVLEADAEVRAKIFDYGR